MSKIDVYKKPENIDKELLKISGSMAQYRIDIDNFIKRLEAELRKRNRRKARRVPKIKTKEGK